MNLRFSRHARRRMQLYRLGMETVSSGLAGLYLPDGKHEIITQIIGVPLPVKLVVTVEDDILTVVTAYPLKKGHKP